MFIQTEETPNPETLKFIPGESVLGEIPSVYYKDDARGSGNNTNNLNNLEFNLYKNIPPHHLHGGKEGFNKKIWNIEKIDENKNFLECTMSYLSPHLQENYPGNLECKVAYSLNNKNEFIYLNLLKQRNNS